MTPQEQRGRGTPNKDPKKIPLNLFPPKYFETISTVKRMDSNPETIKPNNKKGDISRSKDHILSIKYILTIYFIYYI